MYSPQTLQQCKHKVMLEDVVAQLLARPRKDLQTKFVRVKSHIGVQGNEEAVKLATAATDPSKCKYIIGHEGLLGLYWPVQTVEMNNNESNSAANKWMAGELTIALKKAVRPKCQAGNASNANATLYVDLGTQVEIILLPNITDYLWTPLHSTQSILCNVLKARYGQLWNMNMTYDRQIPYIRGLRTATSNECPLCLLEDSGSHLLGGCRHRDMVTATLHDIMKLAD